MAVSNISTQTLTLAVGNTSPAVPTDFAALDAAALSKLGTSPFATITKPI